LVEVNDAPQLQTILKPVGRYRRTVLDLARTVYLDPAGVNVLIATARGVVGSAWGFRIANSTQEIRNLIRVTLPKPFEIFLEEDPFPNAILEEGSPVSDWPENALKAGSVAWEESCHGRFYLFVADWNCTEWEFWRRESSDYGWEGICSTLELVAKAENLAVAQGLKRAA
jgi:hypothetical protein